MCLSDNPILVNEFPPTPLGDNLSRERVAAKSQTLFPMRLVICNFCQHLYLLDVVSPSLTYQNYFFESSKSSGLLDSMRISKVFVENYLERKPTTCLDIGANDGTWLELFETEKCDVFAVEPSPKHVEILKDKGINTYAGYFSENAIDSVLNWLNGRPLDCITINNTLANISDLHAVFNTLKKLSNEDTVVSIVTGYHPNQFSIGMFDYVYHEHLSYFTIGNLKSLAHNYGFHDFRVRFSPLKGGSIQFVFSKKIRGQEHLTEINRWEQHEKRLITSSISYSKQLVQQIESKNRAIRMTLGRLKSLRNKTVGYGYAHSSSTLMYMAEIQNEVERIVDDNESRWGYFVPGLGLEIEPPRSLSQTEDAVLILSWQHEFQIIERLKNLYGGVPFANPTGSLTNFEKL